MVDGTQRYRDRYDAGRQLAAALQSWRGTPGLLLLGLPRGGVPVAAEAAAGLDAPLDVLLVRKIGHPAQPELAVGALAGVAGELVQAVNADVYRGWEAREGAARAAAGFEAAAAAEERELRRRQELYRRGREPLALEGRTVLLVDDGLATGASMRAALLAARAAGAHRLIAAAPVSCGPAAAAVGGLADDVVVPYQPPRLAAVGMAYGRFPQTTDAEVTGLLAG
ncbi:Putative phosphoribosyl transferasec/MT0597 [Arthrobacter saudimassiliensis]|uniref:Putative phosphoribosyl transferasec/MT0597 n=1 Tax=Arthrobacter saudimassiliensis TaxID=1461584 RepID=A0A078MSK9_9MICC|nr:Putative phosphoribosyl transferasec/MT0597 [Arthrobacter saudimassiliensis]